MQVSNLAMASPMVLLSLRSRVPWSLDRPWRVETMSGHLTGPTWSGTWSGLSYCGRWVYDPAELH